MYKNDKLNAKSVENMDGEGMSGIWGMAGIMKGACIIEPPVTLASCCDMNSVVILSS